MEGESSIRGVSVPDRGEIETSAANRVSDGLYEQYILGCHL